MAHNDPSLEGGLASPKDTSSSGGLTRRRFLGIVGGAGIGALLAGAGVTTFLLPDEVYAFETSDGYLLVDTKKCAGCETCMLACSLAHFGKANKSLSRIQVKKNPLGNFPDEIGQNQCRQCADPG